MKFDVFSSPTVYALTQKLISRSNIDAFFEHKPGDRVLDIGCGPGNQAWRFKDAEYIGIDTSPEYINQATANYSSPSLKFICSDVNDYLDSELNNSSNDFEGFDFIFMFGVIHHLSDDKVKNCLISANKLLKPDGAFKSYDGVYIDKQSKLVKRILASDRGKYIRTASEYKKLFENKMDKVTYEIRSDMLRIPYTHIIFTAHKTS